MSSIRDFLDYINFRRFKRYDKIVSRKRLIIFIFGCFLVFYQIPVIFRKLMNFNQNKNDDSTIKCIEKFLQSYHKEIESSDSTIWIASFLHQQYSPSATTSDHTISADHIATNSPNHIDELSKNTFLPLVGNGKFSLSPIAELESQRRFYIRGKRILDVPVPFDPVVNIDEFGSNSKTALVSRYKKGIVERFTCANYASGVISIHEIFTAHRLIPTLLTQEIKISNPTNIPLILHMTRKGWFDTVPQKPKPISITTKDYREYSIVVGQINFNNNPMVTNLEKQFRMQPKRFQSVAVAFPSLHDTIEVHSRDGYSLVVQTFINYTSSYQHEIDMQAAIPDLKISLRESVKKLVDYSTTALQQYHTSAWDHLWQSGFSIAHSHAPNVLNGYQINATLYYLLSQRTMLVPWSGSQTTLKNLAFETFNNELLPLLDIDVRQSRENLFRPDRCYNGHPTFQASRLWSRLDSLSDLHHVISLWFLTLEKQSCEHLLRSGATGVLQAVILSLSGLRFTPRHIEFHSHPSDLQRPFVIRRLFYGNETSLNISVLITEENRVMIQVVLDHNVLSKDFWACDAGCLDSPVRLSTTSVDFPVKLTKPLTSLLYITPDREHVRELKHSIHVEGVEEAPPHEHQTLALHRYGHSLGGLPTFFWISIAFLIIVFHLFLGRMIYNEYFNNPNNVHYERLPYRNIGRYSM